MAPQFHLKEGPNIITHIFHKKEKDLFQRFGILELRNQVTQNEKILENFYRNFSFELLTRLHQKLN